MLTILTEGFLVGLSAGVFCIGSCATVLVPYLLAKGEGPFSQNTKLVGAFLLGRLVAYLAFGAVLGWLGGVLQPVVSQSIKAWSLIVTSSLLLLFVVARKFPEWNLCRWVIGREPFGQFPFLLGLVLGFNLCPPFLVAMARLLEIGNWFGGVLFFFAFFVATSLYLVPFLGLAPLGRLERFRTIGTVTAFLVGVWFLAVGVRALL